MVKFKLLGSIWFRVGKKIKAKVERLKAKKFKV